MAYSNANSKSARKREQHALQALGEQLIELSDAELAAMPLDDTLREAVEHARSIKSRSALRRQRQLIGKLMRRADARAIAVALAAATQDHRQRTRILHSAEQWRERLIGEGGAAFDEFSQLAGRSNETLRRLLDELSRCPTAALERRRRREIFREIYAELDALAVASADDA